MVASTPSGSTPSNGSSSSSTSGRWKAASTTDIRRHMPCEKPAVTRSASPPRSKRSSRSRARSSQPGASRRIRAASARCSHGRGPRDQPADVGAVADPLLDPPGGRSGCPAPRCVRHRRSAAGRRRAPAASSTCRRRCAPPGPPRRRRAGSGRRPSTATTVPKRTWRSRTSTTRDTGESSPMASACGRASAVERVHLGGVLLHDDAALELHRRGQRAGLLGEVDRRGSGTS